MPRVRSLCLAAAAMLSLLPLSAGPAAAAPLTGEIAALEPFLGTWVVDAAWNHGPTVWSRASFTPGLAGQVVEGRVLVQDGDAPPYQRYVTMFAYDAARETFVAHAFQRDGSVSHTDIRVEDGAMITEWTEGDTKIRDRSTVRDDGTMHWVVDVAPAGATEYQNVMDAVWRRQGDKSMPQPIDSNLFSASQDLSQFTVEAEIAAPVETVYRAWSDGDAFPAAFAPDRPELRANIDLAIGGRYEWLWDGETGSNDCQVLSYIPNRMISFSWNAPPEQAKSRVQRTWVVVEFEPRGDAATHCRLTHLGFGPDDHWQETKAYFENAWPFVLEQFGKNLGDS